MAKQRFDSPIVDLPNVGQELESFRRAIIAQFSLQASPNVFRVHELDFVEMIRGGVHNGAYLPVGTVYVDETGTLKAVLSDQQWMMNRELKITSGGVTTA